MSRPPHDYDDLHDHDHGHEYAPPGEERPSEYVLLEQAMRELLI